MALDPNIILQAGRGTPTTDLAMLLQQRSQIRLSQLAANRQSQTQSALDRVRADPSDMTSLADLAALDPQAANGYLGVQAAARAGRARTATADLYRSAVPDAQPAVPGAAPDAGSPAPPAAQPPVSGAPNQGAPASVDPFDHKGPAEQIVGSNVTSGKMTMQEAAAQLADVADPAQVQQVLGTLKSMDDLQFERVSRTNKMMADTLASIKASVPVDPNNPSQPARHAALMQNAPQLAALGITPQQIAQIDLSDQGINGVVGKAMGYQGLIEQAQKDRQFGLETQKQNLEERKQAFEEHKPIAAGFGVSLVDPTTHQAVFDGSGTAGTPTVPPVGPARLAQLTDVLGTIAPGVTPTSGIRTPAQQAALRASGVTFAENSKHFTGDAIDIPMAPGLTPQILQAGYAAAGVPVRVVQESGVGAGQGTGPHFHIERVAVPPAAGGGGAGGMTAAAIDLAAREGLAHGGIVPAGYARNRIAQAAITNRMAELATGKDVSTIIQGGQDTASQGNAFKAWNSGRPGTGAAVTRTINVAIDHLDQTTQAAAALQNGNVPLFNRITNGWAKQTGAPAPTDFASVKDFVTDEVTKAILSNPGGVGDREKAAAILASWNSPAQTAGVIKRLQGLMAGQLHGLKQQYEVTTGRQDFSRYVSPRATAVLGSAGSTAAAIPEGAKAMLRGNPALRDHFDAKYGAGAAASVLGG